MGAAALALAAGRAAGAAQSGHRVPLDIYDSVLMSSVIPLSEQSLAKGSAPVSFPDFTRGKWKTRKPYFALES